MGSSCTTLLQDPRDGRYGRARSVSGRNSLCSPNAINVRSKYTFDVNAVSGALERGGTGVVVVGTETANPKHRVAIKIMDKTAQHGYLSSHDVYMNEVDMLNCAKHPHIVQLIDVGEDDLNFYIVLSLGEGGDLVGTYDNF